MSTAEKKGKSWKKERHEREKKKIKPKSNENSEISNGKPEKSETHSEKYEKSDYVSKSNPTKGKVIKTRTRDEVNKKAAADAAEAELRAKEAAIEEQKQKEEEERIQKQKMIEEEELKQKKILEEQEAQVLAHKAELTDKLEKRAELRDKNILASKEYPELDTSKLDSSLKKNTVFIKKLRNLTESQQLSMEKDVLSLNLSKYVSELAQAIIDTRLKMSDVPCAVHICSLLHQRYPDFSPTLLQHWHKVFSPGKKEEKEKFSNTSKLRVDLRLFSDLISCGIFAQKDGLPLLGNMLTTMVNSDKNDHQFMAVILSFCRHCSDDYMGLIPKPYSTLSRKFDISLPKSEFLKPERQKNVRSLIKDYFTSLTKHLITDHKQLYKAEAYNSHILLTRGELSEERRQTVENMTSNLTKLLTNTTALADLLDEDMPPMPSKILTEEEELTNENMNPMATVGDKESVESSIPIWEDEDTKAFYTCLPQLKDLIPSILYAESQKSATPAPVSIEIVEDDKELDVDALMADVVEEDPETTAAADDDTTATDADADKHAKNASSKVLLEGLLNSLPNCISRGLIDAAALEFCLKMNTKACRRRLAKALFLVPRTRLDLLPFYSRLVGSLHPLMPDLGNELVAMLKDDFRYQVKKKDQINIESKIKVSRFIGELTKFSIFPRAETILCLRMLLNEFSHHHIDMACNIMETCGIFLYRLPDSYHRTKVILDQMMRKRNARSLNARYNTMIENAYYFVSPPETPAGSARVERPPMHQYIRNLLYISINKVNTERILRQIRKLHWEDPEVSSYAVKCLTCVWNTKFANIRCIANLLAGLLAYYDWVGTSVVDGIMEDIRMGMEVNEPKFNQRRIATIKYLGELYNYRVIESSVIFKVLYSLITFGVSWDPSYPSIFDPPDHLMRIRLVCTLLDTCGQFFSVGSSRKKLDCLLTYFLHYYWFKRLHYPVLQNKEDPLKNEGIDEEIRPMSNSTAFPWQIDHLVLDSVSTLRSDLKMPEDYEEAEKKVKKMNADILAKAASISQELKDAIREAEMEEAQKALPTIQEDAPEEIVETPLTNSFVDFDEEEEDDDEETDQRPEPNREEEGWQRSPGVSQSQLSQRSKSQVEEDMGERGDTTSATPNDNTIPETSDLQHDNDADMSEAPVNISICTVKCSEDDDFMSAFDKMLSDDMLERSRENSRTSGLIGLPMRVETSTDQIYKEMNETETNSDDQEEEKTPLMSFVLMTRADRNKQKFPSVKLPVDLQLVNKMRSREQEEKKERDHFKQLTLEINDRQEEEEAQELLQQTQSQGPSVVRERKPRYQHPRGAPDADIIFGSRKPR